MWRPNSLREDMSQGAGFPKDNGGRVQCPNCRSYRVPDCIVDVRSLPIPEEWACDVCWTHWERTERVVDGGEKIAGRFDWRLRWVEAHGAPQSIVDKFTEMKSLSAAEIEV